MIKDRYSEKDIGDIRYDSGVPAVYYGMVTYSYLWLLWVILGGSPWVRPVVGSSWLSISFFLKIFFKKSKSIEQKTKNKNHKQDIFDLFMMINKSFLLDLPNNE